MDKKELAQKILNRAGIMINGDKPYDIQVKDERFYKRVFSYGTVGLGEAYMDGWWDAEKLDDFFCRALALRANHCQSFPLPQKPALADSAFQKRS
jgi:cyclopropane-fatty-acyl-phospholipid synthase